MNKISTIFFDLDGTLVDSFAGIEYTVKKAINLVKSSITIPSLRPFIGPPIKIVLQSVLYDVNSEELEKILTNFRQIYDEEGWEKSICYDGVLQTLSDLDKLGNIMFIVTNKPLVPTYAILEKLKLKSFFSFVICPNSQNPPFASKVEMIETAISNYHIHPDTCLMVGDSLDDAKSAHLNKIKFLAVNYGYGQVHLQDEYPINYTISCITQILNYLN